MASSAATTTNLAVCKPTHRFLEVTQHFATSRLPRSKATTRAEAAAHFASHAPTLLFQEGRPQYKKRRMEPSPAAPALLVASPDEYPTEASTKNSTEDNKGDSDATKTEAMTEEEKTKLKAMKEKISATTAFASSFDRELIGKELSRQQEDLIQMQQELDEQEATRRKIFQEVVDVTGSYRYGLAKISTLADLNAAPDAIMPGNV